MARFSARTVVLLAALAVLACAGAAFAANRIEHAQTAHAETRQQVAQRMLTSIVAQEGGAEAYLATGRPAMLDRFEAGAGDFSDALVAARGQAGGPPVADELTTLAAETRRWQTQMTVALRRRQASGRPTSSGQAAGSLQVVRADYTAYSVSLDRVDHAAVTGAGWLAAGLVAAVVVLLAAAAVALTRRSQLRERARTARLGELRELLQVSASEAESRRLLLRHVGRLLPASGAVVLSSLDSEDRLDPTFGERIADTPLRALPPGGRLRADSCLAVRLGRAQAHGGSAATEPLVRCEVCGRLPGDVACEPLRVNGRTLGAMLVATAAPLSADAREQLRESVVQSAPIFAIQRTLEAAEHRAASDPLTDLPNRRAADEALRRLSAQAGRAVTPLAAVLVDLDHFKLVNDRFGHQHGDEALQAVARVLVAGVRASDFVARYGGEEFLVLAPDTDRRGAADVAEKLRRGVEQLALPAVGRITASFGIAALPEDAVDPDELLRRADRALYAAKALGRNRVEEAEPSIAPER